MIQLPNGCRCSELKVNPANWDSSKASIRKPWIIYYRFYDPAQMDRFPKGKLRIIKGMNVFQSLAERQEAVKVLMDVEINELKNLGFNPIAAKRSAPIDVPLPISPETPFTEALYMSFSKANYNSHTRSHIRSVLKYVAQAASLLHIDVLSIKEVKPSHLLLVLEQCGRLKSTCTNNTYNTYIKYLCILFSNILQYRAIEFNPARDLKKKINTKIQRRILTTIECNKIDQEFDTRFWMFIHIFFHSGSRITEILRVRGEHVDLTRQRVKYLILKGQQYEWVERTIKDIAVPLWKMALKGSASADFVFSKGLKPGPKEIRAEQITRRWRTHVKKKLNINRDFYALKHLNSDQTSEQLGVNAASIHNSHRSISTTMTYAVNETQGQHERVRKINNRFA